jgi:predicted nucleic acid-binding protein
MVVVIDAAPLIFLCKIERLSLIPRLYDGDIRLPAAVRDEVLRPPLPPAEGKSLKSFLQLCQVIEIEEITKFANGLSAADNSVLTLAVREHANFVLTDDRLLRRLAVQEGLRVTGTLGVLLQSLKRGMLNREECERLLGDLVREHQFRIGIEVYEAALSAMRGGAHDLR